MILITSSGILSTRLLKVCRNDQSFHIYYIHPCIGVRTTTSLRDTTRGDVKGAFYSRIARCHADNGKCASYRQISVVDKDSLGLIK